MNKARNVDLLNLCDDLELIVPQNPQIIDLFRLLTQSKDYDEDFVKIWLEVVVTERKEREVREERKRREVKEERTRREERKGREGKKTTSQNRKGIGIKRLRASK